jgi:hypothetical protein
LQSRNQFALPYNPQSFTHNNCSGLAHPDIITGLDRIFHQERSADRKLLPGQGANLIWEASLASSKSFPWPRQVVKKFCLRNIRHLLTSPFKKSKAMKSYLNACHLLKNGLLTPMPLGAMESRKAGFIRDDLYISEAVKDPVGVDEYLREMPDGREKALDVIRLIAEYVRQMHNSGFWHKDLNLSNFIMGSAAGKDRLYLVDLNRAKVLPEMTIRQQALDLSRMKIKREWRPLFFKIYCAGRLDPDEMITLYRRFRKRRKFWRENLRQAGS